MQNSLSAIAGAHSGAGEVRRPHLQVPMENIRGVQVVHACGNIQQGAIDCILHRVSMSRQHVGAGGFEEKQVRLGWGAVG